VTERIAVPLVGQALVGDTEHLGQALADPGRLVVVVLVADRVGDDACGLPRTRSGDPGRHEQVQVALGPPHGSDRRLHHDNRVGRIGKPILLRDGAELQLETGGQRVSLMGAATSAGVAE
jgi:hypothetical protein